MVNKWATPHGPGSVAFGRRGRVETQNATVERNVRVPGDVEESANDRTGDGINIAALAGRNR